ncbi:hypothetical protein C8F04DRAFT_432610 [Mycena alexandri]|uniref:Uncharacterized protein n=1 Tax=Mycena alexandri TaxID=1745969 RepID=A0AAD6XHG5_9AGAR|nr:hypothetical protein C8F04DRAFT_432610 [Mycena alexandri]
MGFTNSTFYRPQLWLESFSPFDIRLPQDVLLQHNIDALNPMNAKRVDVVGTMSSPNPSVLSTYGCFRMPSNIIATIWTERTQNVSASWRPMSGHVIFLSFSHFYSISSNSNQNPSVLSTYGYLRMSSNLISTIWTDRTQNVSASWRPMSGHVIFLSFSHFYSISSNSNQNPSVLSTYGYLRMSPNLISTIWTERTRNASASWRPMSGSLRSKAYIGCPTTQYQ